MQEARDGIIKDYKKSGEEAGKVRPPERGEVEMDDQKHGERREPCFPSPVTGGRRTSVAPIAASISRDNGERVSEGMIPYLLTCG